MHMAEDQDDTYIVNLCMQQVVMWGNFDVTYNAMCKRATCLVFFLENGRAFEPKEQWDSV